MAMGTATLALVCLQEAFCQDTVGLAMYTQGFRNDPRAIYGPGYGQPDAGRLDPDAADGYREQRYRVPDRRFFNNGLDYDSLHRRRERPDES